VAIIVGGVIAITAWFTPRRRIAKIERASIPTFRREREYER